MNSILEVSNLCAKSKRRDIYRNLNFNIFGGEVVGILGHNGAGKSTLIRNITNLEIPHKGEVKLLGKKLDINKYEKDIVHIPDVIELVMSKSIEENLKILSLSKSYDALFIDKYLKKVKLSYSDKISDLSKGNQEIAQLILLMGLDSKLMVLDEPFSAVDIFRRELILGMIVEATRDDRAILLTTHLIQEVEPVLNKIIYIDHEEIILNDSVENLLENSGEEDLVSFLKNFFKGEVE